MLCMQHVLVYAFHNLLKIMLVKFIRCDRNFSLYVQVYSFCSSSLKFYNKSSYKVFHKIVMDYLYYLAIMTNVVINT